MSVSSEQLLSALQWRYATKTFDPTRRIPAEEWEALEESLVLTPSSFGLQPWKFLVIENPEVRTQLQSVSWGQSQVTEASHYVVLTARDHLEVKDISAWVDRMAEVQGITPETLAPYHKVIEGFIAPMEQDARYTWNARQVYIALGQLMSSAALLGIDSCPMEGFDPTAYDRILGLEGSGYRTTVACALGYRSEADKYGSVPKARFSRSQVIRRI